MKAAQKTIRQAQATVPAEFKVRTVTLTWEETSVYTRLDVKNRVDAEAKAREIANYHQCEVRWNFEGCTQGHYVQP